MKKRWIPVLAVIALSALAGAAIAGRPVATDDRVVEPPTSTAPTTTPPPAPTSVVETTTTRPLATTTVATTTIASQPAPDRAALRVVAANGTNRPGLAGDTVERLISAGFTEAIAADALDPIEVTAVLYRPGFENQARELADVLGIGVDAVSQLQSPVTTDDQLADVIVAIGVDFV